MIQLTLETAKQNPISFKPVYSAIENCPQYQSIKLRRGFTWTLMKSEKKTKSRAGLQHNYEKFSYFNNPKTSNFRILFCQHD